MNINQIEQALRNLIASQPMVSTGPSGEVINSIANVIDAFKNLNYRTQTYSSQDNLKFALQNDCVKIENDICNYVVTVLQERGINILLYLPAQNSPYAAYGFSAGQGYVPGQMMYNPNAQMMGQPGFVGQAYGQGVFQNQTNQPVQNAGEMPNLRNDQSNNVVLKKDEPEEQGVFEQAVNESTREEVEAVQKAEEKTEKTTSQETKKEQNSKVEDEKKTNVAQKPIKAGIKPASSSNGRDYLLELLKK